MSEKQSIEQILQRAIQFEEQAYDFYVDAVPMVKQPHIQQVLKDMAGEEIKHRDRLQALLDGDTATLVKVEKRGAIQDLKLAEYLVAPTLGPDASFQDILVVAMHREKSSFEFYSAMASIAEAAAAKDLFGFLAQEELMHKNRIETVYDEVVYQDN
jgi:rubrerythrin